MKNLQVRCRSTLDGTLLALSLFMQDLIEPTQHSAKTTIGHRPLLLLIFLLASLSLGANAQQSDPFEPLLYLEHHVNDLSSESLAIGASDLEKLPEQFNPSNGKYFPIRYLWIPKDMTKSWTVENKNRPQPSGYGEMIRFWIHPLMESHYQEEIERFGPLQEGYEATPTASPRALHIRNKVDHSETYYEKVSLGVAIGGVKRFNSTDKLIRAVTASEVLSQHEEELKRLGIFFLPENQSVKAPFHEDGNISRTMPFSPIHPNGKTTLVPAFSLFSLDPQTKKSMLSELMAASDLESDVFLKNYVIDPVIRAYSKLALDYGLIHESHTQNVLFVVDDQGRLTGQIVLRDLDSIKTDFEIRALRGLDLNPYQRAIDPFDTYQAYKATKYYDTGYKAYIRTDWSHKIEKALKGQTHPKGWFGKTIDSFKEKTGFSHRRHIARLFDQSLIFHVTQSFGSHFVLSGLLKKLPHTIAARLNSLFPGIDFINPNLSRSELRTLIENVSLSYFTDERISFRDSPPSLNNYVARFKTAEDALGLETIKSYIESGEPVPLRHSFPIENVATDSLRAGQVMIGSDLVLSWARDEVNNRPENFVFDVVKAGTNKSPKYMLVDGHHRAWVILQDYSPKRWRVRVIEDITDLDEASQSEILEERGFFWNPATNQSHYLDLHLSEMTQNFWRGLAANLALRKPFASFYNDEVYQAELIYAKKLYDLLLEQGLRPDQMQEQEVVNQLLLLSSARQAPLRSCQAVFQ